MRILLPGGSGQIGTILARSYLARGYEVTVLSRKPIEAPWNVVHWDGRTIGPWADAVSGADVVINLAGRSVDCRYNPENRRLILDSRVDSTRVLGEAITSASSPPPVWLQSSTATIYAHRYDAPNDEASGVLGGDEPNVPDTWKFSIDVAKSWEKACIDAETPHTRKVLLRSAMIMSPDRGGVFDTLLSLVRKGLGGKSGNGRQYMSWIHDEDFVAALDFLIANEDISGPVNLAAPRPLPNTEFMRALRQAWGMKFGLPATEWMLAIGTWLMRTETELVLKSRRVVPGRLLEHGFTFAHSEWHLAAKDLCQRWREGPEVSTRVTRKS